MFASWSVSNAAPSAKRIFAKPVMSAKLPKADTRPARAIRTKLRDDKQDKNRRIKTVKRRTAVGADLVFRIVAGPEEFGRVMTPPSRLIGDLHFPCRRLILRTSGCSKGGC
jgi:hypothetical protein